MLTAWHNHDIFKKPDYDYTGRLRFCFVIFYFCIVHIVGKVQVR